MLKPKEAALVLAKINAHHGNMQLDRLSVQTFHEELRPDATLTECMEAVRRAMTDRAGAVPATLTRRSGACATSRSRVRRRSNAR